MEGTALDLIVIPAHFSHRPLAEGRIIVESLKRKIIMLGMLLSVALTGTAAWAQSAPQFELPKVGELKQIGISYASDGRGKIMAGDKSGRVQQYLEIWVDKSKDANVVTYILVGDNGKTFSATWGKGPVNPVAFNCRAEKTPEFGEKSFWVATDNNGVMTFQEIQYEPLKGLFENLGRAREDWKREVNSPIQRQSTSTSEQNILLFLKEKNRKMWLEQGWLRPATLCVRHFI
jgi:hypothetical protein